VGIVREAAFGSLYFGGTPDAATINDIGLGLSAYWNCDTQNPASIALARKLGYPPEKKYKLIAWLR
jgi:hypothetical protein